MVLKLEDLPHSLSLMSVTWSAYGNTGDQKLIKLFDANAPQALDIKQVCLVWYCMFYIALLALQDMCEVPLLGILEQAAFLRPTRVRQENLGEGFVTEFPLKSGWAPKQATRFSKSAKGLLDVESRLLDWTLVLLDAFIL